MASLKLYNSLTRQKEAFEPLDPAHIRVYACGPTVYNYAHIGNARMAVVFDQWARVLRTLYPAVTYVSNITDVEDKIITASRETGLAISDITLKYEGIYNEDMASLGVQKPDVQPRATEHIGEMITQIEQLIGRGHAYAADGHVLFDVPSDPSYGALSGRSRDEQIAGARVEIAPYKKDAADFVLWKPSSGDEPGWDSPWGFGRPGWHIECSAMAEKHLGLPFDIHGGGADLKFPHHENEIAQSCCANGHETDPTAFAKYWVHNGFVTVEGEKMSKSLGNFLLVHDLIGKYPEEKGIPFEDGRYPGQVLRLTLLSAHYRQPLDWSKDRTEQNWKLYDKVYERLKDYDGEAGEVPPQIMDALCDDLNTPQVIAELHALAKKGDCAGLMAAMDLLGLPKAKNWKPRHHHIFVGSVEMKISSGMSAEAEKIEDLLQQRTQAKKDKNFARADEIRDELAAQGIVIEDTPAGPVWKKAG